MQPMSWNGELVGARLTDAYRTAARLPMRTRPKEFGSGWPGYVTMTAGEIQQLLNEAQLAGTLRDLYADLNRVRIQPSSADVEKMEEALMWPLRYLRDDSSVAMIATGWAAGLLHNSNHGASETPQLAKMGFDVIANGLNRDKVRMR